MGHGNNEHRWGSASETIMNRPSTDAFREERLVASETVSNLVSSGLIRTRSGSGRLRNRIVDIARTGGQNFRCAPVLQLAAFLFFFPALVLSQTDWPVYGHDSGATRYSPLQEINKTNVSKLQLKWIYDTEISAEAPKDGNNTPTANDAPRPRARLSETTPLVIGDVMYMSTPYNRVLALEPDTGKEIWRYESPGIPAYRGLSYWPGEKQFPPQIVFATTDGLLISLNANSGKPVAGFGAEGIVNLRGGVADHYPDNSYGLSSPPVIYHNLIITGSHVQESPALGPWGDIRAWDIRNGRLAWTFHTVPRPGELNHDAWQDDQWVDKSGVNCWGLMTVDVQRGTVFVPLGTPTPDYWGCERKGSNLYGSSLVALDATTGKLKWYFQTTHHDNWDYDLTAAPVLIDVTRNGKTIPAVAEISKQSLLFILNRTTGTPIYSTEEHEVARDNRTPGDENWPTQPVPVKPPALGRTSFRPEEISTVTPEHAAFCKELLASDGGALTGALYAQYGPKMRVVFPSFLGGANWGGASFDPKLGYLFVNTQNLGGILKLVKNADGTRWIRKGPALSPAARFWQPSTFWPCQRPPWGELSAVNVNTGDVVWRVPLGEYDELKAKGIPKTGALNIGGSIVTAGGLVFIGATLDDKFRAFDARTGEELWVTKLHAAAHAVPITYQTKGGKQYVAIMASGDTYLGDPVSPGKLYVFTLP
jgi:glucose dehydrogenase